MYTHDIQLPIWDVQRKEEVDWVLGNGGKVVVIDDEVPPYLMSPVFATSAIHASFLLPEYTALSMLLNEDFIGFESTYKSFLYRTEQQIGLASIICAAINKIPIAMLYSNEEFGDRIRACINSVLHEEYGLYTGTNLYEPKLNRPIGIMLAGYVDHTIEKMFLYDLFTADEFLLVYKGEGYHPTIFDKLMAELHPYAPGGRYAEYFDALRSSYQRAGKVLVDPMEFK